MTREALLCRAIELRTRYGVGLNGENLAALVQQADAHRPPKGY
jgi:hypothetical protein